MTDSKLSRLRARCITIADSISVNLTDSFDVAAANAQVQEIYRTGIVEEATNCLDQSFVDRIGNLGHLPVLR